MMAGKDSRSRSYQESLRKIGAWLDAAVAFRVNVLEIRNGFAVRYQEAPTDEVVMQRVFTHDDVRSLRWGDLGLRRRLLRRFGKGPGLTREPGGYQDLFRALGYQLDEASAWHVMLDENDVEDTLTVTYHLRNPGAGDGWTTQINTLGPAEREATRQAARLRRQGQPLWSRR
jgi:hypothetical protein